MGHRSKNVSTGTEIFIRDKKELQGSGTLFCFLKAEVGVSMRKKRVSNALNSRV